MEILEPELLKVGIKLNLSKCTAFVPNNDCNDTLDSRITKVKQVHGGLPALGSAYRGEFESLLGPYSLSAAPALKRLDRAKQLVTECTRFANEAMPEATLQSA